MQCIEMKGSQVESGQLNSDLEIRSSQVQLSDIRNLRDCMTKNGPSSKRSRPNPIDNLSSLKTAPEFASSAFPLRLQVNDLNNIRCSWNSLTLLYNVACLSVVKTNCRASNGQPEITNQV